MADLRREYGIDLLDLWRGRLSFYELCAYLSGLPADCRTMNLIHELPDETIGWGTTQMLLAALLDTVRNMFADEPVESVLPKALLREPKPELEPMSALAGMFGSPDSFAEKGTK